LEVDSQKDQKKMSETFKPERKKFEHNGRTIYEWEQTLDAVDIFIQLPEGTR